MTMPAKTAAPVILNQPNASGSGAGSGRVRPAARAKLELRQPKTLTGVDDSEIEPQLPSQVDAVSINPADFRGRPR